jgi:hypothetical protein
MKIIYDGKIYDLDKFTKVNETDKLTFDDEIKYVGVFIGNDEHRLKMLDELLREQTNLCVPKEDFDEIIYSFYYDLDSKKFCDYIYNSMYKEIGIYDFVDIIKQDHPKPKLRLGHVYHAIYKNNGNEVEDILCCFNDTTHDKYLVNFHNEIVYLEQISSLKDVTSEKQLGILKN